MMFCFTNHMLNLDPEASERLASVHATLRANGLIDVVREAAGETWRANRERYEPEDLFDDTSTLGYQTSKNLANRLANSLGTLRLLAGKGVSAALQANTLVNRVDDAEIRLVKAQVAAGRSLSLESDFDWQSRETRLAAASRNASAYRAPKTVPGHEPMFELPKEDPRLAAANCRDFFVVWAGDMTTGLTAGWLGIPTTDPGTWLAVDQIWWDDLGDSGSKASTRDPVTDSDSPFTERPSVLPTVRLKSDHARESTS